MCEGAAMPFLSLLMFVAFQGKPQAAPDQVILERLRKAVFYENSATLQKRCPPSLIPIWQRLQKRTDPHKQTGAASGRTHLNLSTSINLKNRIDPERLGTDQKPNSCLFSAV